MKEFVGLTAKVKDYKYCFEATQLENKIIK